MVTPNDAKARAISTYDAAADSYDNPANSFWERFGRRTIERLHLQPGARVLDVCCGSGASAIPAAEKVGPEGFVLGVDLAEKLLERGRSKATKRGLQNLEFRVGDMLDLRLPRSELDAVVCVRHRQNIRFGYVDRPHIHHDRGEVSGDGISLAAQQHGLA